MDRTQKEQFVAELRERLGQADSAFAVAFGGLNVTTITDLRKQFRDGGVEYRVIKNTLARLAAKDTPYEPLTEHLTGPTALVLGFEDVVAPAKILHGFLEKKENQGKIEVKGGVVQGKPVSDKDIEALAKLPGLPELRAQMLALFNTPATQLARLINTPGEQLARVVKANADKAGEGAEAA